MTRKGTASGASSFLCSGHCISRIASAAMYANLTAVHPPSAAYLCITISVPLSYSHAPRHLYRLYYTEPYNTPMTAAPPRHYSPLAAPARRCAVHPIILCAQLIHGAEGRTEPHTGAYNAHAMLTASQMPLTALYSPLALLVYFLANGIASYHRAL